MADKVPNAVNPPIKTLLGETHTTDMAVQTAMALRKLPAHNRPISQVTGLQVTGLQVTGLQTALDSKQDKA